MSSCTIINRPKRRTFVTTIAQADANSNTAQNFKGYRTFGNVSYDIIVRNVAAGYEFTMTCSGGLAESMGNTTDPALTVSIDTANIEDSHGNILSAVKRDAASGNEIDVTTSADDDNVHTYRFEFFKPRGLDPTITLLANIYAGADNSSTGPTGAGTALAGDLVVKTKHVIV